MLQSGKMERGIFEIVGTESLAPTGHLLRKIDASVDFSRIYDDCVICPEYQALNYSTTNRDGYREYKSDPGET